MAAFEVLALDTTTPQIRAPGASDTYTFPRAVELPLGTANGVLYLNGSKVVSSGSNLTFDGAVLAAGGAAGNGRVYVTNSVGGYSLALMGATKAIRVEHTATQSNISGVDSTLVGSYEPIMLNGSIVLFGINGSEQMRLNSTGLGIGTSSPGVRLDVESSGNSAVTVARIRNTTAGTAAATRFFIGNDASAGAAFIAMTANANSTNPNALTISNEISDSSSKIIFNTQGAERMRLDANGNLGLGVTPSATVVDFKSIEVGSTGNGIYGGAGGFNNTAISSNAIISAASVGSTYARTAAAAQYRLASGTHAWFIAPSGTAGNTISFTQAMTLDASGNLMLGTTTPNGKLTVTQDQDALTTIQIINASLGSNAGTRLTLGSQGGPSDIQSRRNGGTTVITTAGVDRLTFDQGGNVVVGNAAIATNATNGFLYVPTCAGTPTGTPTTYTGRSPIVVDSTNNKLYFYSGGAWRDAGP